jgi:hypothetical protein
MNPMLDAVINVKTVTALVQITVEGVPDPVGVNVAA